MLSSSSARNKGFRHFVNHFVGVGELNEVASIGYPTPKQGSVLAQN